MDLIANHEILSLVANLGALTVLGFLYFAYIKNLNSSLGLKNEQIETQEKRITLLQEKNLDLERKTPEFVEKILTDRIQVREEELIRLSEDAEKNAQKVSETENELNSLRTELQSAHAFGRSLEVYDRSSDEMRTLKQSELELVDLGTVSVDSATLFIGDPYYFQMSRELEIEEYPQLKNAVWYRDRVTGDTDFSINSGETFWDDFRMQSVSLEQLVNDGRVELIDPPESLPADPSTYIKGNIMARTGGPGQCLKATFFNGLSGAGISVGIEADGDYTIRAEKYKGRIVRLMVDV